MWYRLAADLVAVCHLLTIAFAIFGALLAWRWKRLLWVHLTVFALIAAVNLSGSDCPLTTWEKSLRRLGHEQPYSNGFIAHYLVDPVHSAGITPGINLIIYTLIVLPTVVGYGGYGLARRRRTARPGGQHSAARTGEEIDR